VVLLVGLGVVVLGVVVVLLVGLGVVVLGVVVVLRVVVVTLVIWGVVVRLVVVGAWAGTSSLSVHIALDGQSQYLFLSFQCKGAWQYWVINPRFVQSRYSLHLVGLALISPSVQAPGMMTGIKLLGLGRVVSSSEFGAAVVLRVVVRLVVRGVVVDWVVVDWVVVRVVLRVVWVDDHGYLVVDCDVGYVTVDCPGIPAKPVSTVAVITGGTGVTGVGGLVQSFPEGTGVFNRPKARFIARNNGKGSKQQRFVKSSKSTVQAAIPPYPAFTMYFVFIVTISTSS
jgi:hypothetical protein